MEKKKTGVVDYVDTQIFRVDGRNVFVEVLSSAFTIGKVQMNFIEYDPLKGNKQVKNIPIYMDIADFLVLGNDILSGRIPLMGKKSKEKAAASGSSYPEPVYQDLGGVTSFRVKAQKRKYSFAVPEGSAISRTLYLTPGIKADWMISGQLGLGTESAKGLIIPQGRPAEIVRVPMSSEMLKGLVLVTKMHIEAFYVSHSLREMVREELLKQDERLKK